MGSVTDGPGDHLTAIRVAVATHVGAIGMYVFENVPNFGVFRESFLSNHQPKHRVEEPVSEAGLGTLESKA